MTNIPENQFPSNGLVYSNSFGTPTEICNDGRDNDGDGKIDAEDLDCPAVPEICNNLLDDDCDGFKDAEDLNSCPAVPEICNNLLDDDRDGFKDAADEDCLTGYHYAPFFTATGSNRVDVPDAQNLRLSQPGFTVATWFKTTANFPDEGVMVNKGGLGSESAGANQNYGLWFTPAERLQGGFETTGGTNRYITSANTYNDGQWHHGVVTFDNSANIIRLFVDGTQIGTLSTTSNPDNTGSQPLRIAGNAQSLVEDPFIGQLDEVGVWNRSLIPQEITALMNNGMFPANGKVYSNSFGVPTEICNNGVDDDGDELIDAEDVNSCPAVPEICNNLLDDDRDGFKDAEDLNSCPAVPEICNNLLDDDRDGFKDGLDPDCQVTAYCFDFQWGSEGTGNGQFIRTHDIGFDSAGFVYVP